MTIENGRSHRRWKPGETHMVEPHSTGGSKGQTAGDRRELLLTAALFISGGALLLLTRPSSKLTYPTFLSLLGIPTLVMAFFYGYVLRWQGKEIRSPKNLRIIAIIVLLTALICRAFLMLANVIPAGVPNIPLLSLEYSIPVALAGVLLSIIFNPRLAFAGALGTILLFNFFSSDPFQFFLVSFAGSLAGISSLNEPQERISFLKAGGIIGIANMGTILVLSLFHERTISLLYDLLCGGLNGLIVGIMALGLLPFIEYLFGITTNFKLLEVSNLHQQILRHLILVAPGTYHHSIVVGTLAEAAAEAIGANSLLVRVSSYYHDIGKIKMPAYFIENQKGASNPHNRLSPSMSSLILTSHVREGMDLARENQLPNSIIDIIQQHHGTCLITYFYQKAKGAENPKKAEVREEEYRYAGPNPQSKEAAIVMLADAVEATSRVLSDPTTPQIQGMVQRIINGIFVDGQLEECDLTLRDLHLIAKAFVRILIGIFHHRVQYPGFHFEDWHQRQAGNGNINQKSPKEDKNRSKPPKRGYAEDIRRLGVQ